MHTIALNNSLITGNCGATLPPAPKRVKLDKVEDDVSPSIRPSDREDTGNESDPGQHSRIFVSGGPMKSGFSKGKTIPGTTTDSESTKSGGSGTSDVSNPQSSSDEVGYEDDDSLDSPDENTSPGPSQNPSVDSTSI